MMLGYLDAGWLGQAVVSFLTWLNGAIYGLVRIFCGLFTDISNSTLFGDSVIQEFTQRIYVVLGIYMLFKLAISLLTSIVNPDNLLDKEKGMQKIIPRTVIALVMLILVPSIFSIAFEYQNKIALAVPKIIIGRGGIDNMEDQGEILASTALKAFIEPNTACDTNNFVTDNTGTTNNANIAYGSLATNDLEALLLVPSEICRTSSGDKVFTYEFNGFISLVAGIFMVVSLASYCVDIAIRSIKLGLLQLLAPIPIISYIDPKSEKDGAFGHWVKESISTYLEVFIKLGILYFVIFILGQIAGDGKLIGGNAASASAWVKVFLIIGAFFFMGKAADFICNIIGVKPPKDGGGFFKGLAGIGAAVGIGAAGISGAVTNYRGTLASQAARGVERNRGKALASSIFGAGIGIATGGKAAAGAKSGKFGAAIGAAYKRNVAYSEAAGGGATILGKAGAYLERSMTGQTTADKNEATIKGYESYNKALDKVKNRMKSEMVKSDKTYGFLRDKNGNAILKDVSGADVTGGINYKSFMAAKNAAAASGQSEFNIQTTNGLAKISMENAELYQGLILKHNESDYLSQVINGTIDDREMSSYVVEANNAGTGLDGAITIDATTSRDAVSKSQEFANTKISELNAKNTKYRANSNATKPR